MKLSVIIVNYNVKEFLEQCLLSVQKALQMIDGEVIVVDNNSVDGSCQMLQNKFPKVKLISNDTNTGFSKANNQGILISQGEYILLLNPDTIVEEDCFLKCVEFMDNNADAGALGVKMIDGKGNFLKESKRGLPTPWVAFYKMSGLASIFPKSKRFAKYYLGHLPDDQTSPVDVLAGAFILLRKTVLNKIGLLDENFFMYGEDIDLSYRITQSGYKNYYFPETKIIHYKGESTKKGSLNYVKIFYKAMLLFSEKHFSTQQSRLFNLTINASIYFRAFISVLTRLLNILFFPIMDFVLIILGYYWIAPLWETIFFDKGHFPSEFYRTFVPIYAILWIAGIAFTNGYRKPGSTKNVVRGVLLGSLFVILSYSFFNETWRFSRMLILLGSLWALSILPSLRILLATTSLQTFKLKNNKRARCIIVANQSETKRIKQIVADAGVKFDLLGVVSPNEQFNADNYLGNINQIKEIANIHKPDEIIFSGEDAGTGVIIDSMLDLCNLNLQFKIAPAGSQTIIGSNSANTSGDLIKLYNSPLTSKYNQLKKRWFDLKAASLLLVFFPFLFWAFENKRGLVQNCLDVIKGKKSWVGFAGNRQNDLHLPKIKEGILNALTPLDSRVPENKKLESDRLYAKNYRILTDLEIIIRNFKRLGR